MLEEGGHYTAKDFDLNEAVAYPRMYQELGNRTTDDLSINVLQGRTVGGGTTVNWCTCLRTPAPILEHWRDAYGVHGLSAEALAPHFETIEAELSVAEWPAARMNANNRVLWEGLGRLGYAREQIRRNVKGCVDLGFCGLGCPTNAKQSMLVTLIPDALRQGMRLFADTFARRIRVEGRRAVEVEAEVKGPLPRTLRVRARTIAVCGGAINSPALLLRSGLTGSGRVGRRTFLHPVVAMVARFEDRIDAFYGAPQAVYSRHFSDRGLGKVGFILETPPVHPVLAAVTLPGFGESHQRLMSQLAHVQALIAITADGLLPDEEGGTVRLRKDSERRVHFDYPLTNAQWEAFREASKVMALIQLAAGAREVMSLHTDPVVIRSEADVKMLDNAPWEKLRVKVLTAHQMGGCPMGGDRSQSVVDSHLRYWDLDNLFVVDGSVFPTGIGVNPQETIFALASWGAAHVAASVRA
jgi:choline dehydrogenase-like flavoprotein